jgi:hypothetical protein
MGLAALPSAPAAADLEMIDPIVLPHQRNPEVPGDGDGDVVRLPGTRTLVVAGGDDNPVVVVVLSARSVTEVPGTTGVRTLDLDEDGRLLHGTTFWTHEVVEIDPWADELDDPHVTRRWTISEPCMPTDAVMRGGAIWLAGGCTTAQEIRRLDPTSGAVTVPDADLRADSIVGEPHGPGLYLLEDGSWARLTRAVADAGSLSVAASEDGFSADPDPLMISEDGGTLFVPEDDGTVPTFDAATLARTETWTGMDAPRWADPDVVGGSVPGTWQPLVMRRDDLSEVNRFLPDDASQVTTSDVRLVEGGLVAIVWVGGEKRVYVVDEPLMPEPTLELELPWGGATGIGTPTPVTGSFRWNGEPPVEPMELALAEVQPTRREVSPVTTDANGDWSATWVPDTVGWHVLEIRYAGTRDSVARVRAYVEEVYQRVDLTAPTSVDGGEVVPVTVSATENGLPLPGVEVTLNRWSWTTSNFHFPEVIGTLVTDEQGLATFEAPPGAVDGWFFGASWILPNGARGESDDRELSVAVDRQDTVVTVGEVPETAVPGDPVDIPVRLTTAAGEPLAGQQLRIGLANYQWATVTTDDDGRATYVDNTTTEGWTRVDVVFAGTLTLDDSFEDTHTITRRRIADVLTISGPTTGEVGTPTGFLGSVAEADGPLELTLDTGDGSPEQILTDAEGSWTAQVVPPLHGPNWITVSFAGNTRLAPDRVSHLMTTPRATPVITIDPVTAQVGSPLDVTGRIDGLLYRSPVHVSLDGGEPVERWTDGDLWFYTLEPLTEPGPLEVTFAYGGDERHEPATETVVVEVAPAPEPEPAPTLRNALRGGTYSAATAPYRVYDTGVSPRLRTTVEPQATYGCVVRVIQRLRSGTWQEVDRRCLDHAGERVLVSRMPARPARTRLRVRTELAWAEEQTLTSTWAHYRFRR